MSSGDQITLTHVILNQNKRERQKDLPKKLVRECNCEKCGLNLGEDSDYNKIRICLDYHLSIGMSIETMNRFQKIDYGYDFENLFCVLKSNQFK